MGMCGAKEGHKSILSPVYWPTSSSCPLSLPLVRPLVPVCFGQKVINRVYERGKESEESVRESDVEGLYSKISNDYDQNIILAVFVITKIERKRCKDLNEWC